MDADKSFFVLDGSPTQRTGSVFDIITVSSGIITVIDLNTQIVIQVHRIGHCIHHYDFYLRTNERFALQEEFDRPY